MTHLHWHHSPSRMGPSQSTMSSPIFLIILFHFDDLRSPTTRRRFLKLLVLILRHRFHLSLCSRRGEQKLAALAAGLSSALQQALLCYRLIRSPIAHALRAVSWDWYFLNGRRLWLWLISCLIRHPFGHPVYLLSVAMAVVFLAQTFYHRCTSWNCST